ncbi:MAG TPA: hypothetical protein VIY30_06085 [Burkholderiaceae bacterium]
MTTRIHRFALAAVILGISSQVRAQSSEDLVCNRAAQDLLQTCQKRIAPVDPPMDPNNLTAAEQQAKSKHAKAWQACKEKSDRRAVNCRR